MLRKVRRLFYPNSTNNHKAALLHPAGLSVLIGIFLLCQSFLSLSTGLMPGILGFASDITPEAIISFTNQKRGEDGLRSLELNDQLSEAARQKAADMFALDYWAHVSPRGVDPWHFILNAGYQYRYAGENLARDFAHSKGVVEAWLVSPSHRENILNNKYQEIGVAVVNGTLQGQETTLVVQMFGAPQTAKPKVIASHPREVIASESEVVVGETEETIIEEAVVADIVSDPGSALVSRFDLNKSLSLGFTILLFGVLILDGWIIWRRKTARIAGPSMVHVTFVIILIAMILLSQQGAIL